MTKKSKQPDNVLMMPLTERGSRNTAAMLKRRGYTQATIEDCRRKSPIEIASFFEPMDSEAKEELIRQIARAADVRRALVVGEMILAADVLGSNRGRGRGFRLHAGSW